MASNPDMGFYTDASENKTTNIWLSDKFDASTYARLMGLPAKAQASRHNQEVTGKWVDVYSAEPRTESVLHWETQTQGYELLAARMDRLESKLTHEIQSLHTALKSKDAAPRVSGGRIPAQSAPQLRKPQVDPTSTTTSDIDLFQHLADLEVGTYSDESVASKVIIATTSDDYEAKAAAIRALPALADVDVRHMLQRLLEQEENVHIAAIIRGALFEVS